MDELTTRTDGLPDTGQADMGYHYLDPIVLPTPTPTLPCIHNGDVNFNGYVTVEDALITFQITMGLYTPSFEEYCAADCSGDGSVTAGDAQWIFAVALGIGSCVDPLY